MKVKELIAILSDDKAFHPENELCFNVYHDESHTDWDSCKFIEAFLSMISTTDCDINAYRKDDLSSPRSNRKACINLQRYHTYDGSFKWRD